MNDYKFKVLFLGCMAVILLVLLTVFLIIPTTIHRGKTPVTISVFPTKAVLKLNNQPIKSGTAYLEPGAYTLEASYDGFESGRKDFYVDQEVRSATLILTASSEKAKKYLNDNQDEYNKVFGAAQEEAQRLSLDYNERNPIVKELPYKTFFYSIGYRSDKSDPSGKSIIIEIDAPEGYRQSALYQIRKLGYDPTDFTINFRDYENPFPL